MLRTWMNGMNVKYNIYFAFCMVLYIPRPFLSDICWKVHYIWKIMRDTFNFFKTWNYFFTHTKKKSWLFYSRIMPAAANLHIFSVDDVQQWTEQHWLATQWGESSEEAEIRHILHFMMLWQNKCLSYLICFSLSLSLVIYKDIENEWFGVCSRCNFISATKIINNWCFWR